MLRAVVLALGLFILGVSTGSAHVFLRCDKAQSDALTLAIDTARAMSQGAAAAVADTPEYRRWFGRYSTANAEIVRDSFKNVHRAIEEGRIRTLCRGSEEPGCKDGTYAYVYPSETLVMTVCPPYFTLPTMDSHQPGAPELENGTQEGTIIHELSHFQVLAGTEDFCYARSVCAAMAARDPAGAIRNADSFQYFAEDVVFFPRVPVRPTGRHRPTRLF